MLRLVAATLLSALLLVGAAMPALAQGKPDIVENEPLPPEFFDAGVVCDFDLRIDTLVNAGRTITFPADEDGVVRQIAVGRLVSQVTNLETGASVTYNISGPGKFLLDDDVIHVTGGGPWLLYAFPGDAGGPGMWFVRGRLTIDVDVNTGQWLAVTMPRNVIDVCAALGGASATA